jgi:hypothetical protein
VNVCVWVKAWRVLDLVTRCKCINPLSMWRGKVFANDVNESELQLSVDRIRGMLATMPFRFPALPVCCLQTV